MIKKVYLVIAILLFILFPEINSSALKSFEKDVNLNNGVAPIPPSSPFIVGDLYILEDLDPHFVWDDAGHDIINHICEGLYKYNLSHPSHELIPHLASTFGTWSVDGLELTVSLHEGITFHDGYKFNASAVKWSFDRLAYLMNVSGTLPGTVYYGIPTILRFMYEWPDGTPIINRIEVLSEYMVRFILNRPYGAFWALLCFPGSYIVSPLSTPATDYIDPNTGDLVGTGPFILDEVAAYEIRMHAYENYWRGKAHVDQIVFVKITDPDARHLALLNGDIHFLEDVHDSYINIFKTDNNLTVLDSGKTSTITQILGMNNKQINITWRNAISYALNYSAIIENLKNGRATRLNNSVPKGIIFVNDTFNIPVFDLITARSYMNQMGHGIGFANDAEWIAVAQGSSPFATFNYSYNNGNLIREGLRDILINDLALIGIKVEDAGLTWEDFKDRLYNWRIVSAGWDALQLYFVGWIPDFNDPSNYINGLFSNTSTANSAQVNDPYLQTLMEAGLAETDPFIREPIYNEIQRYLVDELRPHAWLYVDNLCTAHHKDLNGFQQNGLDLLDFYSCTWGTPPVYNYTISINSPADINFVEGTSGNKITWTLSAVDLSNPTYNITVNGVLNRTDSWQSGVPILVTLDHLSAGTYTYQISAKNENEIIQDEVVVIVNARTEEDGLTILLITIGAASGVGLAVIITILVMRKRRK